MRGNTLAVVVANRHHEELSQLVDQERIYFAERPTRTASSRRSSTTTSSARCRAPQD